MHNQIINSKNYRRRAASIHEVDPYGGNILRGCGYSVSGKGEVMNSCITNNHGGTTNSESGIRSTRISFTYFYTACTRCHRS